MAPSSDDPQYPPVNLALAQRLERAEGLANAAYVEARAEVEPGVGATWEESAGAYLMFDGPASPLTQTFGVGITDAFGAPDLDQVEEFFFSRGAAAGHEVSAFAAPSVLNLLSARGYHPVEASVVLVRPTCLPAPVESSRVTVRVVGEGGIAAWARVAGQGWSSESAEIATFVEALGGVIGRARGVHCFLAELGGRPIAAAGLNLSESVALLAGASTIPDARRQGAQFALLEARLAFAAAQGCGLAMVVTQPGSASQRNALRQGFRPVYTRAKWQREPGGLKGPG